MLDIGRATCHEGCEDDRDEHGSRGDDATRALQSEGDGIGGVPACRVLLGDTREHEDLVVHGECKGDHADQDERRHVDGARHGVITGEPRETTVLEDPHEHAQRRGQAEQVEHEGLDRDEHAAGVEEEDDQRC